MKPSPEEYDRLKAFFRFFFDKYFPPISLPREQHPVAVLDRLEASSPAQAAKGLAMAVNDCVELSSGWTAEKVAAADAELKSRGLLLLSEVRTRYSRRYLSILKRASIRSEEEYFLVKGVANGGSIEPGSVEKDEIERMLEDYEQRTSQKKK